MWFACQTFYLKYIESIKCINMSIVEVNTKCIMKIELYNWLYVAYEIGETWGDKFCDFVIP